MVVNVTPIDRRGKSSEDSSSQDSEQKSLGKAVKKRWHSKTRTGCGMCKKRRVKCDEMKPRCLRCRKKGIQCPGYNPPVVRIFELSDEPDFDSASEKQAFDVFITKGSRIFAIANNTSMHLWIRTIPQLAYRYKAVRHAIIAIGAVQLQSMTLDQAPTALDCHGSPAVPETTLIHRLQALQTLYKTDPAELPIEVVVSCAMFMMVLDVWTDNGGGPGLHLVAAFRLLQEHCQSLKTKGLAPSHEVAHLFIPGIDYSLVTTMSVVDDFPSSTCGIPSNYRLLLHLPSIGTFNNFTDALYTLDLINKAVARHSFGHHAAGIEQNISTALSSFRGRVYALFKAGQLSRYSPEENSFRESYLSAHHRATDIMFQTAGYTSEADFSPFHDDDFAHIVSSMKLWLTHEAAVPVRKRKPNLGVLPPLFLVATKCRHSQLRDAAIELLHSTNRSERGWSSCIASMLARFVADSEKLENTHWASSLMESSPDHAGVSHQQLLITLDKVGLLPTEGCMRVRYWEQRISVSGRVSKRSLKKSLPYQCQNNSIAPIVDPLSARTLRAYGYSGILLMAPELPGCQCLRPETQEAENNCRHFVQSWASPDAIKDEDVDDGRQHQSNQSTNKPGQPKWWYQSRNGLVAGSSGWFQWRPEGFDERGGN